VTLAQSIFGRAALGIGLGTILAAGMISAGGPAVAVPQEASSPGHVYILQGLPGRSVDLYVNNQRVGSNVAAKTVIGPMSLAAGSYDLKVTNAGATTTVLDRTLAVAAGRSVDAVVHLNAQAKPVAKLTVFGNDTAALNAGKTRLAIAHTADVPPADIRVDGKVLFSNVANGEGLTTVVPAATYRVDIVPTGTSGPAILGPADFALKAGTLTRVFAIGQPSEHNMDAIVQILTVNSASTGQPRGINTGSGGRAGASTSPTRRGVASIVLGLVLFAFVGYRIRARHTHSAAP
jgi:hypothetical protein